MLDKDLQEYIEAISSNTPEQEEIKEEVKADLTPRENSSLAKEEREKLQNKLMEEDLKDRSQDRDQRKDFADRIFNLMCWYLAGVFFIIILNGITINNFHVSDEIILALLGTTAIEVIGTFTFVAKYLYHNK